ncbi:MAG: hypothetical protein KDI33_08485 [Halioglobus sp.]|nr:hypothetical protein [Halioglobus sp.]
MASEAKSEDSYKLFMEALEVTNSALEELRDKPVIKNVLELIDEHASGRKFGVAIYADSPDDPFDYYTVRLNQRRIEFVSRGKDEPDIAWKVSTEYLRDVVENSDDYISNPLKLDLDWLKQRLQDAA